HLRSREFVGIAEPRLPGDRRREPFALVETGDQPRSVPGALRGRSDPARRPGLAGECRWPLAGGNDPRSGGRDRVQRLVRHRARPRARSRSGSAVRTPLPHRRREPEIRGALSPGLTSSGRRRRVEAGKRLNANARAYPAADQRPPAPRLPQLPPTGLKLRARGTLTHQALARLVPPLP